VREDQERRNLDEIDRRARHAKHGEAGWATQGKPERSRHPQERSTTNLREESRRRAREGGERQEGQSERRLGGEETPRPHEAQRGQTNERSKNDEWCQTGRRSARRNKQAPVTRA